MTDETPLQLANERLRRWRYISHGLSLACLVVPLVLAVVLRFVFGITGWWALGLWAVLMVLAVLARRYEIKVAKEHPLYLLYLVRQGLSSRGTTLD